MYPMSRESVDLGGSKVSWDRPNLNIVLSPPRWGLLRRDDVLVEWLSSRETTGRVLSGGRRHGLSTQTPPVVLVLGSPPLVTGINIAWVSQGDGTDRTTPLLVSFSILGRGGAPRKGPPPQGVSSPSPRF